MYTAVAFVVASLLFTASAQSTSTYDAQLVFNQAALLYTQSGNAAPVWSSTLICSLWLKSCTIYPAVKLEISRWSCELSHSVFAFLLAITVVFVHTKNAHIMLDIRLLTRRVNAVPHTLGSLGLESSCLYWEWVMSRKARELDQRSQSCIATGFQKSEADKYVLQNCIQAHYVAYLSPWVDLHLPGCHGFSLMCWFSAAEFHELWPECAWQCHQARSASVTEFDQRWNRPGPILL